MMIECAPEKRAVHRRVRRQHRRLVAGDLGEDRLRQHDLFVLAVARLDDLRGGSLPSSISRMTPRSAGSSSNALSRIFGSSARGRASPTMARPSSWRDAQLLVVAAQVLDVEDLLLGQEVARRRRWILLADDALSRHDGAMVDLAAAATSSGSSL